MLGFKVLGDSIRDSIRDSTRLATTAAKEIHKDTLTTVKEIHKDLGRNSLTNAAEILANEVRSVR